MDIAAIKAVIVFGLILAFCFWELYALRRLRRKREADKASDQETRP